MYQGKAWTSNEDELLKKVRENYSISKWSLISKKLAKEHGIIGRTGKQCRQRFNYINAKNLHSEWTRQEQLQMFKLHDQFGNRWAIISQKLTGRTDNSIKNHFYSKLRRAIRKLNRTINDNFRRQFKEIKINILYKILQAADQKFKTNPTINQDISSLCCRLKNILLMYSYENQNKLNNDLSQTKLLVKSIYQFSYSYRRKAKRCRKSSGNVHDIVKFKKSQKILKSFSEKEKNIQQKSINVSQSQIFQDVEEGESQQEKQQNEKTFGLVYQKIIKSSKIEQEKQILIQQNQNDKYVQIPQLNRHNSSCLNLQNFDPESAKQNIFCNDIIYLEGQSLMNQNGFQNNYDDLFQDQVKLFTFNPSI